MYAIDEQTFLSYHLTKPILRHFTNTSPTGGPKKNFHTEKILFRQVSHINLVLFSDNESI